LTRDPRKYLWDIAQAADQITAFTSGRSYENYLADAMLRAAVERQFTIIGEAVTVLDRIDAALASKIPEVPSIIAFRNILIHAYADIDHEVVWGIISQDLQRLRAVVAGLLSETP
jgi:uncharacterized protein with HEPN domain